MFKSVGEGLTSSLLLSSNKRQLRTIEVVHNLTYYGKGYERSCFVVMMSIKMRNVMQCFLLSITCYHVTLKVHITWS